MIYYLLIIAIDLMKGVFIYTYLNYLLDISLHIMLKKYVHI